MPSLVMPPLVTPPLVMPPLLIPPLLIHPLVTPPLVIPPLVRPPLMIPLFMIFPVAIPSVVIGMLTFHLLMTFQSPSTSMHCWASCTIVLELISSFRSDRFVRRRRLAAREDMLLHMHCLEICAFRCFNRCNGPVFRRQRTSVLG